MISLWTLEKQVSVASIANRIRRRDITERCQLIGQRVTRAARKPAVLGSAALVGFCLGRRKHHPPGSYRGKPGVITRLLPLVLSYLSQTHNHDTPTLD
ncbi:MAG: hypothetical protein P1U54_12665 [Immundisolibacteraceae bacterium]|nr:hypothetical protein [Immundisolibacteraceae bacterium]